MIPKIGYGIPKEDVLTNRHSPYLQVFGFKTSTKAMARSDMKMVALDRAFRSMSLPRQDITGLERE
jgi:hypothetical protein